MPPQPSDFFKGLLEDFPEAAYFSQMASSFGTGGGQMGNLQRYYQDQFRGIYNEYLGAQGQQAQQGQLPDKPFQDFLGDYPFVQRFASLAPSLKGTANFARFAPPTRYLPF